MKHLFFFFLIFYLTNPSFTQPEVAPWSNIKGIRLDGELVQLNSSLGFVGQDWTSVRRTAKERAAYSYERSGNIQHTPIRIDSFLYDQRVEYLGAGKTNIRIHFQNEKDTNIIGQFFMLSLPGDQYHDGEIKFLDPAYSSFERRIPTDPSELSRGKSKGISIRSASRNLDIQINESTDIFILRDKDDPAATIDIYFGLMTGPLKKGTSSYRSFTLEVMGIPDRTQANISLYPSELGRQFKGFGGNFRLQNPTADPPVIDYCLRNLDVRWGRVEMPWRFWHPEVDKDPVKSANADGLHPRVEAAMQMAKRLDSLGMPVILSDWSAPNWAIEGQMSFGPQPGGLRGNPLDQEKIERICRSIGDYIQYAKDHFGFEFAMFSFNESDLGINVRQTAEEHAAFIKGLGAHLQQRGIKTKMLLGDTADANGWPFLKAAMEDEQTHPYIGAVSFHSWRGYTDQNLYEWYHAAEKMEVPLLVGEGSMDAGAWRYPQIFSEPMYAMEEANLYVRILRICQPESILQWQLTADYSPMIGGGVFGNTEIPLQPTQRFWNFKQIANQPADLKFMPVKTDHKSLECTGLADPERNTYLVHVVNNGASRSVRVQGIPSTIEWIKIWVTNENSNNARRRSLRVRDGIATFDAEANSCITLLADGESPF
ncbi:MAG: hypothetical protein KDC80_19270 [Saprospiraceae bacterium]|nr:hypothetical protein [Saprospiraceae bacterium]